MDFALVCTGRECAVEIGQAFALGNADVCVKKTLSPCTVAVSVVAVN